MPGEELPRAVAASRPPPHRKQPPAKATLPRPGLSRGKYPPAYCPSQADGSLNRARHRSYLPHFGHMQRSSGVRAACCLFLWRKLASGIGALAFPAKPPFMGGTPLPLLPHGLIVLSTRKSLKSE
jgi:hypothetical protein